MPTEGHLSFLPQDDKAVTTNANTRINLNFFINNLNNYSKIKEYLANKELHDYLNIANTVGNQAFILKYKSELGDLTNFIAEQNKLSPKFKIKLPALQKAGGFITTRSLEQCTAEAVANYKSTLIIGDNILTLASGLGIDDMAIAANCQNLVSVDNDEALNALAEYNFNLLGLKNIVRLTQKAEEFIANNSTSFDAIYIDPDRRDGEQRQLKLAEHQPNVINLLPNLLNISSQIWIKCSPLYDLDMAQQEFAELEAIYIISFKGEVKEMLLKIGHQSDSQIKIFCTDIGSNTIKTVEIDDLKIPILADTLSGYFYEAGASLVKARRHHAYAHTMDLKLIDKSVPFYIGPAATLNFMGKCMAIKATLPLNPKQIKLYLKSQQLSQINIKARGVKCDIPSLFKTCGVKEGGEDFLFLTPFKGKQMAIHCESFQ